MCQYSNDRDGREKLSGRSLRQNSTPRGKSRACYENRKALIRKCRAVFDSRNGQVLSENGAPRIIENFSGSLRILTIQDEILPSNDDAHSLAKNAIVLTMLETSGRRNFTATFSKLILLELQNNYTSTQRYNFFYRVISARFLHGERCAFYKVRQLIQIITCSRKIPRDWNTENPFKNNAYK